MNEKSYRNKIRRYKIKCEVVKQKGNKCTICGWSGNIAAFHLHHIDPSKKEFTISGGPTSNWEKICEEIKKCNLLCANCHAIIHAKYDDKKFLEDVEKYNGRDLKYSTIPWKNQTHIPILYKKECPYCKKKYRTNIKNQKYCSWKCRNNSYQKCKRPSKEELKSLLSKNSVEGVGRLFGVTGNAIRKWSKSYQIF